ncbi:3-hydroxyisobutyrate dehydrogenase-like beta-hydroxyacid dehydrogenase [Saccharothrix carnea]|uniref:3-hydroxyisobutyrate dehydrogenase-like beta-hydroxyacid dehydrogenase n=1 Tax=Saccharothrix carnea TaxID=1280637 RepID=A0A2P8IBV7_SACCR|nr:NAD(P)-binding domain-containing protein [Saccharothrix carnea]PSL55943.1 3-hydroxyisobutyrate dehydrogenase-like beta-hydroxyacid dehydrogenase [Saccharothrix carnea]
MNAPVSVIGLGNLGRAVARVFLAAGHPTTVWNRSAGKAAELVAAGATSAPTAAEAFAASPLVVVAVLDPAAARDVLAGVGEAARGRAVVNLTSGGPDDARTLAEQVAGQGADYLHGAVYAVPQTLGTDDSTVNYSGAAHVHEEWRAVLDLLGKGTFLGPDAGRASAFDMAILAGMYGMLSGFLHAAAMGRAGGIDAAELTPPLVSWLTGIFPALSMFADEIDRGDYATEESSLDMNRSGLATILRASASLGVAAPTLQPFQDLVDRQVAEGHGAASLARVVESFGGGG